ncbi:hypothetical protein [Streptomyces lichenis]|uniref:Uncharacterized protein n=1 Tax=Streptomyces lichenis TaxID=2306967 RepID=A0ABT0IJ91_9ACTN|nr:hypothetical protein [Streptomyces lichenis]MCK8681404.1 hypothetical protein [Streptomyces lichenis]
MRWIQEYVRGDAVTAPRATGPAATTGTSLTFRPDPGVFGTAECSFDALAERIRELAFLNRALDITLTDERPPEPRAGTVPVPWRGAGLRRLPRRASGGARPPGGGRRLHPRRP